MITNSTDEVLNERYVHLPVAKKPFKNASNQRYTKQLFYETWSTLVEDYRVFRPPFTLNSDIKGLINFGRRYIQDADPSGYTTAMALLGDFAHWEYLMKSPWFKAAKAEWDRELEAKLYAEGMQKLREILTEGDDAKALQAAKILIDPKHYSPERKAAVGKRGRPTSEEIEGELKEQARQAHEFAKDAERIGLKAVK